MLFDNQPLLSRCSEPPGKRNPGGTGSGWICKNRHWSKPHSFSDVRPGPGLGHRHTIGYGANEKTRSKIAAHISMMKKADIMIMKRRKTNYCHNEESHLVKRIPGSSDFVWQSIECFAEFPESRALARQAAFLEISGFVKRYFPDHGLQAFLAVAGFNNSVFRKRGLRGGLKESNVLLNGSPLEKEEIYPLGNGSAVVCGAFTLTDEDAARLDALRQACHHPVILYHLAGHPFETEILKEPGWPRSDLMSFPEFPHFLQRVCERDGLLVRLFGHFDDPEAGAELFGKPSPQFSVMSDAFMNEPEGSEPA